MASCAPDLGMSPKQFWQEYGARILGDPDVKGNAKGSTPEVKGKAPSQWRIDALKQSWGHERFKSVILETPNSIRGKYDDLALLLKPL